MRALLSTLAVLAVTITTVQCTTGRVSCFYGSWAIYHPSFGRYAINDIPVGLCTHIMYAYAGVSADTNEIMVLDNELDLVKGGYRNFTSLRSKFPDVKFIISVGGWDEGGLKYSQMVSKNSSRATFTKSVVSFLKKYKFDGMDLEWLYPGQAARNGTAADKDNLLYLMQELKAAFVKAEKNWELSASVALTKSEVNEGYHVPELCKTLDAVNVMGYNLRGEWDGFVDLHSKLYNRPNESPDYKGNNVNDGLSLWEELGCPPNKMVVTLPFFGKSYTLPTGSTNYSVGASINKTNGIGGAAPAGPYTETDGEWAYFEICTLVDVANSTWTKKWENYAKSPYAYSGNQWVGYEDTRSMEIKMKWIKTKGYLGAATWSIDLDDFRGLCGEKNPLLKKMYKYMSTYTVPRCH